MLVRIRPSAAQVLFYKKGAGDIHISIIFTETNNIRCVH